MTTVSGIPIVDRKRFESEFVAVQPNLRTYLFRITANIEDAEDLTHETYVKAAHNLDGFEGRSTLKTWIFAIATNLARDHRRAKHRWCEDIQDRCRATTKAAPDKVARMHEIVTASESVKYEFKEHIDFCFTCIAKTLPIEQQLAVVLKEVYNFRVAEIAEILRVGEGKVKHALADGRQTMIDVFDRRCALVNQNGACWECSEINGFVNPKQEARAKEQALERAARAGVSRDRLFSLRAELVRGVNPLHSPGTDLHTYLLGLMPEHADDEPEK